jgi:hypothetical protein
MALHMLSEVQKELKCNLMSHPSKTRQIEHSISTTHNNSQHGRRE